MVDLFTNVKGSGFATPIPGGTGSGTPATAKLFNGNSYNAYEPQYIVDFPYSTSYNFRIWDISDINNPTQAFYLSNSGGGVNYPTTLASTSIGGAKRAISKDGYLYKIGSGGNSLHVIDATDVSSMQAGTSFIAEYVSSAILGCTSIQGHPTKDILWLSSNTTDSLLTIDITNPASPSFIGEADLGVGSWLDFCTSYDGEYAFIREQSMLKRVELDGLNAPTNVTDIASGISVVANSDGGRIMQYTEDQNGTPYIIVQNTNEIEIFTLDSSYNVTDYVSVTDADLYDDVGWIGIVPHTYYYYPTAKFGIWITEEDDSQQSINVWDGSSFTRPVEVQSSGDFVFSNPITNFDTWGNYLFYQGEYSNNSWRILEWNTVNTLSFITSSPSTSYTQTSILHVE